VTDEIITGLAGLAPEQLAVIARTTAMRYKGSHKDVAGIGRELGVDYIVEGSVHRADEQIGMNVQLIQVSDQTHLWTGRYHADLREVFDIESAATQAIAAPGHLPKISRHTISTFRAVIISRGALRAAMRKQDSASSKRWRGTRNLRWRTIPWPSFIGP
jgi:hypothetical protein